MSVLDRLLLSAEQWERMSGLIIGRPDQRGSTGRDNRMFVEGVLWIVRTGSTRRFMDGLSATEATRRLNQWRGFLNNLLAGPCSISPQAANASFPHHTLIHKLLI